MPAARRLAWLAWAACAGCASETPAAPATDGARPAATALPPGESLVGVDAALRERAQRLFTRALEDDHAIVLLTGLLAAAPKRLAGSDGAAAAVAWCRQQMQALGLQNVRTEPVLVPRWVRGEETAAVVSSQPGVPLRVTALGGSVPTPTAGLRAEVVMVRSFEQLRAMGDAARGKIVFFNRPMPRALQRTFRAYGEAVPQRTSGAVEAGMAGAVAALVRSVTTAIDGNPHTGAMSYEASVPPVPAAAIASADAELLAELLDAGPVTLELRLGCQTFDDVPSANVLGELVGSERPDEVVLIGAHLDAWDLGEGAHDDGAGCAHVLEAMRLLAVSGIAPRRTIRAVLFMNEENGLRGAKAYAAQHAREHHAAAIETDGGGATPHGFSCSLRDEAAAPVQKLLLPLTEFGAGAFLAGGGGGADIAPLGEQGTVLFGLITDGQRYFDYHHSALDTLDKVNERELALGAAALAYAASVLADR